MQVVTPYQLNEYTSQLTDIYAQLEQDVFLKMAEILKTDPSVDRTRAIEWQVEKLQELRLLNQETVNALAQASGLAREEIISLIRAAGIDTIYTIDEQVRILGLETLNEPSNLDSLLQAYIQQTFTDLDNFVNLRLIDSQQFGDGAVTTVYKRIIEETVAQAIAGNKTINQVVTDTIIRWRERGLPSGFTDRSGRVWDVQNYVDLAVRTTVNNTYNELTERRIDEYGYHLVRVDYYPGARPACQGIQGTVASLRRTNTEGYHSVYDFKYKEPDGFRGINCRHRMTLFVDGVSTNNNHPPDATEANEYYKKQQKQRALEREVRKAKRNLQIAEATGDERQIAHQKALVRARQQRVKNYVEENDLPRRYDKERVI